MKNNNKCDAAVCFGAAGTRSPRVCCELCSCNVHTKCANISNAVHKSLRDSPGVCWLCVKCRDPDIRKSTVSDTTGLILQRTTSALKLIGVLVETMQLFCKLYSQTGSNSCHLAQPQTRLARDVDRSLGEVFQDPLNFTNLFESIIGDKRQRTSSVTGMSSSPPDKIARVDVPIPSIPATTTTNSNFSDAAENSCVSVASDAAVLAASLAATGRAAADAISQLSSPIRHATNNISPVATTSTASLVVAAERATTLAVEQATVRAAKHAAEQAAAHAAELASAQAAVYAAEHTATQIARQASEHAAAQAATHAAELAVAQAATLAAEQAAAHVTENTAAQQAAAYAAGLAAAQQANFATEQVAAQQAAARLASAFTVEHATAEQVAALAAVRVATPATTAVAATQNAAIAGTNLATHPMEIAAAGTTATTAIASHPTLSVAPVEVQRNWMYITRFLPCETSDNIINYVQDRTNCDRSLIHCQKLARQNKDNDRPLSFVSFKISVPEKFEPVITSDNFWPSGISIKPFLVERPPLKIRSRARSRGQYSNSNVNLGVDKRSIPKQHSVQNQPHISPTVQYPIPQLHQYHQLPVFPHYQFTPSQLHQLGIPRP